MQRTVVCSECEVEIENVSSKNCLGHWCVIYCEGLILTARVRVDDIIRLTQWLAAHSSIFSQCARSLQKQCHHWSWRPGFLIQLRRTLHANHCNNIIMIINNHWQTNSDIQDEPKDCNIYSFISDLLHECCLWWLDWRWWEWEQIRKVMNDSSKLKFFWELSKESSHLISILGLLILAPT